MQCPAGAMDVMPAWTLDQIAGLAFGVSFYNAVIDMCGVSLVCQLTAEWY